MKKRTMLIMLLCVVSIYSWTANLPPNENPKPQPDCCKNQPCNDCVSYQITFGRAANEPTIPDGQFSIYTLRPNLNLFSPANLHYYHPLFTQIIKDEISSGERIVQLQGENREAETYIFRSGESIGYPGEGFRTKLNQTLVMLDAEKQPTTETPIFYRLQKSNGSQIIYSVISRKAITYITPTGRILSADSRDLRLEVIYSTLGGPQQVYSGVDGLADIVVVDEELGYILGYEIRIYAPEQVGDKNDNGLYTVEGSPHTIYRIQNPSRPSLGGYTTTDPSTGEEISVQTVEPPDIRNVIISKKVAGLSFNTKYSYSDIADDWIMNRGDGEEITVKEQTWNSSHTVCTEIKQIKDNQGKVSYQETITKQKFSFGDAITQRVVGDGENAPTTWYGYYTDSSQLGCYGKRYWERHSNGTWKKFYYDNQERIIQQVSPFKNQDIDVSLTDARVIYYLYSPVDARDVPYVNDPRPRVKETKIGGVTTHKEYFAYFVNTDGEYVEIHEQCQLETAEYGNATNARTERIYYASDADLASAGRLKSIKFPNGKLDTYTYAYGNYLPNAIPQNATFVPASNGLALRSTIVHGTWDNPAGIAFKSTKEECISDCYGNQVMKRKYICLDDNGTSYDEFYWQVMTYNSEHKLLNTYNSKNEEMNITWNCCEMESFSDINGIQYSFTYDNLMRLKSQRKLAAADQLGKEIVYSYNSLGKILRKVSEISDEIFSYDLSGRLISQTLPSGINIIFQYENENTGSSVTKTQQNQLTQKTSYYKDLFLKSVTGTMQVSEFYDYGVLPSGKFWIKKSMGTEDSMRWETVYYDLNNRICKKEKSGFNGNILEEFYIYNSFGQLSKIQRTNQPSVLFVYNNWGELTQIGFDANGDGILELASKDRILQTELSLQNENGHWWKVTKRSIYGTENVDHQTIYEIQKEKITNLAPNIISEIISTDIYGNTTTEKWHIDREKKITKFSILFPFSLKPFEKIFVNGYLNMINNYDGRTMAYYRDGWGRIISETTSRLGTSYFTYHDNGSGKIGKLASETDPAGNKYEYDYEELRGLLSMIKDPLDQYTFYSYNSFGKRTRTWGSKVYPQQYNYDHLGQMTELVTFRQGSGWDNNSWPQDISAGEITKWTYDAASGLLISKIYANQAIVNFSYSADGKLTHREWARQIAGDKLSTIYGYNDFGQLKTVTYSDDTPSLSFTYNRLGLYQSIIDQAGSRNFTYNEYFDVIKESLLGSNNITINRSYAVNGVKGRYTGLNVNEYELYAYSYDDLGRLSDIITSDGEFNYSRLSDSNLISEINRPNETTTTFTYETTRDLIQKISTVNISDIEYVNNGLGYRIIQKNNNLVSDSSETYTFSYNNKNEIISCHTNYIEDYSYIFSYDNIGNFIEANSSGQTNNYITNNVNQYTSYNTNQTVNELSYDADGNTCSYNGWELIWNGENRLIEMTNTDTRLTFKYDYMGRRIEKSILKKSGDNWELLKNRRFTYDNYKLIEERDGLNNNTLLYRYIWQPKESLDAEVPLCIQDIVAEKQYFYLTDGNKNVYQIIDETGNIVAEYKYDPFGKIVKISGSFATNNPIRFSSEYYDSETGLIYFNYRYYSPQLGRWLSRDPLGENGGINLYAYVGNSPISRFDLLGLYPTSRNPSRYYPTPTNIQEYYERDRQAQEDARRQRQKDFDEWVENEKKQIYDEDGNIRPDSWIRGLTPCPENYDGYDPNEWEDGGIIFSALQTLPSPFGSFHPGGKKELRTKNPQGGPGNQCIYDECGNLISDPPGAGSADKTSPNHDQGGHMDDDVVPYKHARGLDSQNGKDDNQRKYYDARPSVYQNGNNVYVNGKNAGPVSEW